MRVFLNHLVYACFFFNHLVYACVFFFFLNHLVYACFLDLSKAIELVDHKILIEELLNDDVPLYIVHILGTLFKNTEVCVHFYGFFFK